MYTHISMFRFRDRDDLDAQRNEIRRCLESFPAHIPYIQTYSILENCLPHPKLDSEDAPIFCDLIQIITFTTQADLSAYPHDPYHMAMVRETSHMVERVCITDFYVSDEEDGQRMIKAAADRFGRIDIASNNAGIGEDSVRAVDVSSPPHPPLG